MSACLLIITDRPRYLERARASIGAHLPVFEHVVVIDDTAHELGFAGAIQEGWRRVLETGADWVWHAEDDFTYNRDVPLRRMIGVLKRHPYLAQLVLKRQPWNPEERAAGGIVEQHPDDFTERRDGDDVWIEHRRFWSTNPSVYSTRICRQRWPQAAQSEGLFTHHLLADPHLRFAFWGAKHDPPLVTHIGADRAGHGY